MRTRQRVESAKGKARQGRRVSLCGAGLEGKPRADRLRESGGFAGAVQAAPPFLPTPPPHLHPPPPRSSSSSSLSPLRHSSYRQEKGAGQKAARRRAPAASKISSIGQLRRLLVFSAFLYIFVGAAVSGLRTPCFPAPVSLSDVLSQWTPSRRTRAITPTLTRASAAAQ